MLLAWFGHVAAACTPAFGLYGFDAWVDGATEVPTDARITVLADAVFDLTLIRLDTLEVVPTVGEHALYALDDGQARVAHTPAAELAPATTYEATVTDGDDTFVATFTTGDGPTAVDFAPPVVTVEATSWGDSDAFVCSLGSPVVERTVTSTVELPADLPVGSFVALRSEPELPFDVVEVAAGSVVDVSFLQGEHKTTSARERARRDCLTPVIVLPSGEEIAGDPACVGPLGDGSGRVCSTSAAGATGALPLLVAFGVRRRRPR